MDITHAWENLENALKKHLPNYLKSLGEPATLTDIAELEAALGKPIDSPLRDFFLRHSGETRTGQLDPLFRYQWLLPVTGKAQNTVVQQWKFNCECEARSKNKKVDEYEGPVQNNVRYRGWIPLATDISGNGLYYDLEPAPGGAVGQILDCDYEQSRIVVVASSLSALLDRKTEVVHSAEKPVRPVDPHSKVFLAWNRFEAALENNVPAMLKVLDPPAAADDLDFFEAKTGIKLPPDIRDFFLIHNGENASGKAEPLFSQGYLIPLATGSDVNTLSEWRIGLELGSEEEETDSDMEYEGPVRPLVRPRRWLFFSVDYSGNGACIDLDPPPGGTLGQILDCDYEGRLVRVVANSIAEYLDNGTKDIIDGLVRPPPPDLPDDPDLEPEPQEVLPGEKTAPSELLEITIKVDKVYARAEGAVLSTPTLKEMDLELRLVSTEVLKKALVRFAQSSRLTAVSDPHEGENAIAFTLYRPRGADEKAELVLNEEFTLEYNLYDGISRLLSLNGRVIGAVPGLGQRTIFYLTPESRPPESATLLINLSAPKLPPTVAARGD